MKPLHFLATLCLLLILLSAATAAAGTGEQKDAIDIDFREAALADVLQGFAALTEAQLELDPQVTGPVTLRLDRVVWSTALDALCDSVGCRWRLSEGEQRVLKVDPRPADVDDPVSLELVEADVVAVLQSLARFLSGKLQVEEPLHGGVSLTLRGVAASTALDAICQGAGCQWQLLDTDPRVLVVEAAEEKRPASPKPYRTFGIENRDPPSWAALEERVSLNLNQAGGEEVLRAVARLSRVELQIAAGVEGTVTGSMSDITLREALDELCLQLGCHWRLEGDTRPRWLIVEP